MLSTDSLSAFSSANLVGYDVNGVGGASRAGVTPIRETRMQPAGGASRGTAPGQAAPQSVPPVAPGQNLPRGSLLNLSV